MALHRWIALGSGPMTAAQAQQWATLPETSSGWGAAETPLTVSFGAVVCAVCLDEYEGALPDCPGAAKKSATDHAWQAFFTAPLTDEEARAWADPDLEPSVGRPQSINVICVLCGESADDAPRECRERALWTTQSKIDFESGDFSEGSS